jgi:hypothetical protein
VKFIRFVHVRGHQVILNLDRLESSSAMLAIESNADEAIEMVQAFDHAEEYDGEEPGERWKAEDDEEGNGLDAEIEPSEKNSEGSEYNDGRDEDDANVQSESRNTDIGTKSPVERWRQVASSFEVPACGLWDAVAGTWRSREAAGLKESVG